MAFNIAQGITLAALVLALVGCSSRTTAPDLAASEPINVPPAEPLPAGPLTAAQISGALKERTFNYAVGSRKGRVTYFADGTFSYAETGKGEGTGLWQASEGKLCEARNPTSFLPKGTPSSCNPFSANGTVYSVGAMRLEPG